MPPRIFILSPASCSGLRAQYLFNDQATFNAAVQVRKPGGAPLGDVFSFLSGLYFRGKRAYANAFARPPAGTPGVLVITPDRGLIPVEASITLDDLRSFAGVPIDEREPRYAVPLEQSAVEHAAATPANTDVVLLGSIATKKYCDVLLKVWGDRLRFPAEFVGRGDMSRGGLLLRCVEENRELEYVSVAGAPRRGVRPAKLPKRT